MSEKYAPLFTPFKINNLEIKNRFVMCPMGGTSLIEGGEFNAPAARMYLERAKGGVGLIVPGIAHIQDMFGRGNWLNEQEELFMGPVKDFLQELHSYDTKMIMQLGAGMGRVLAILSGMVPPDADLDYAMFAPSELPNVWDPSRKHRPLKIEEIEKITEAMIQSAELAKAAGMDGVEIHAIHEGYLLDQFSIANTNHREDRYGGDLDNRLRFTTDIIKGIKERCGEDFPVSVRYSVTSKMKGFNKGALPGEDYKEFGRNREESKKVAKKLEEAGCDVLNADNGSYDAWYWAHPPMYMPLACNLDDVAFIKQHVDIPVICAGRMEDPDIALDAIASGKVDGIGIARQFLTDPDYVNKIAADKVADIRPCIACHYGCFGRLFNGEVTSCTLNPAAMQEAKYEIKPAKEKKKIMVVGGGIGGMELARLCALRGHDVSLYEKSDELGGVFIAAVQPDFKEADRKLLAWYKKQVHDLDIDIHMNTEVTPELIKEVNPDHVYIATGAKDRVLNVQGVDQKHVHSVIDFLMGRAEVGDRVAVIGGGLTGTEVAVELAKQGKKVTLVEMLDDILQGKYLSAANSNMLRDMLAYYDVDVRTSTKLTAVNADSITVVKDKMEEEIPCDSVILATGYVPNAPLADAIGDDIPYDVIGDAKYVGTLMEVVWDAYDHALKV